MAVPLGSATVPLGSVPRKLPVITVPTATPAVWIASVPQRFMTRPRTVVGPAPVMLNPMPPAAIAAPSSSMRRTAFVPTGSVFTLAPGWRVAVDDDGVQDGVEVRRRRDRVDAGARDVERDRVQARVRVGVEDRLAQRSWTGVVGVRHREGGGGERQRHRADENSGKLAHTSPHCSPKRLDDERGHLSAVGGRCRAVEAAAAAGGDAARPRDRKSTERRGHARDVGERRDRADRRRVAGALEGPQQQDRHLLAQHRVGRAVVVPPPQPPVMPSATSSLIQGAKIEEQGTSSKTWAVHGGGT